MEKVRKMTLDGRWKRGIGNTAGEIAAPVTRGQWAGIRRAVSLGVNVVLIVIGAHGWGLRGPGKRGNKGRILVTRAHRDFMAFECVAMSDLGFEYCYNNWKELVFVIRFAELFC